MLFKEVRIHICDIKNKDFADMSPVNSKFGNDIKENVPENNETTFYRRSPRKKVKVKEESEEDDDDYKEETKPPARRKVVKIIDIKPEDESSSDSDEDIPINGSKKTNGGMSEYEKMIERNRAERMAFLQSIKMEEAKAGLIQVVDTIKKKKVQPVKRMYKQIEEISPPVIRKSRRLANMSSDLSEDALFNKALQEIKLQHRTELPPKMSFKEAMQFQELYDSYAKDVCIQESETECKFTSYENISGFFRGLTQFLSHPWKKYICPDRNLMSDNSVLGGSKVGSKFVTYDKSVIKKLTLDTANVAKVTPSRITALAWYPSSECLVLAAGSKYGDLGIWNVDSESNPYVFKNHVEGTTNLQFNPLNRVQLVSSSYDGTLRSGDMVKHTFDEIYNISNETSCTYFDFLSQATYLVAQKNGQVVLVDNRTEGKRSEKKHTCHDYSVKTVNVHPVNKNFFVTAENKGCIRLWDLRKLQKQPVANITHHRRCVLSAYFSPVTGNSILATSADDTISIFDSTNLTKDIKLKQQMKHNNCTGRWLSVFRATWLPNSEENFVIGSMQEPRRIQVYNKNMDVCHIIMHENLTTISSTNAFHPFRPTLAGANSSGKVFVLT